jgi:hypothetical protein
MLAVAMLAIGVAVGAAIGPAPTPSFAVGQVVPLLRSLTRTAATATVQAPPVSPQATPAPAAESNAGKSASSTTTKSTTSSNSSAETEAESTTPASTTPTSTPKAKTPKTTPLPPITKVWLIELANSSFTEAAAQPSAAAYIDGQVVPAGTLLSGWSAIDGSAFANDAALIASTPPQLLDTIVQPPCPEGAAGAQCAPETPGALVVAGEFLRASLATITATPAYRESGLVVVTFASIAVATATGLPAGASTATLTSQPPAGVLLISPFARADVKSSTTFNPASPEQSLEKLLRR